MGRTRFCPSCGAATEPRVSECRERDYCPRCPRWIYENAKPCAGALVLEGGRVLLAKRTIEPFYGCWDLPGGFLEADEHPEAGALREVFEETGLRVRLTGLLGIYMDLYVPNADPTSAHHSLNFYYLAEPVGGVLAPQGESSEARYFAPEELPEWEAIAYENGRQALRDWLAGKRMALPAGADFRPV